MCLGPAFLQSRAHLASGEDGQTVTISGMKSVSGSSWHLPFFGSFSSAEEVRDISPHDGPWGENKICPQAVLLFLDCSSLVSASPPSPDCCCSCLFPTPWTAAHQTSLSFTISWSVLKVMSVESMMPSNHLIFCCPLLFLPSIFLSQYQGLLQWANTLHQVAKVMEFQVQLQHQSFHWIFKVDFL